MPKQIIKWTCNLCNTEYHSEKAAASCEQMGLAPETAHIHEGDTIKFTRNVANPLDEIATFVSQGGVVKHIVTTRNDKTNKHQSVFVVQTENDGEVYEGVVAMLDVTGSMELFMAAKPRYQIGFADTLKSPKTNGE